MSERPKPVWRKWEPLPHLPAGLWLDALHDDYEGVRVLLCPLQQVDGRLRLRFPNPLAYRVTGERHRGRTWTESSPGDGWALFRVENSPWVAWFSEEAGDEYAEGSPPVTHYAILADPDVIEVLTATEPTVEWLDRERQE